MLLASSKVISRTMSAAYGGWPFGYLMEIVHFECCSRTKHSIPSVNLPPRVRQTVKRQCTVD